MAQNDNASANPADEVSMPNTPAPSGGINVDWRLIVAFLGAIGIGSGGVATFTGGAQQATTNVADVKAEVQKLSGSVENLAKSFAAIDKNVALLTQSQNQLTRDLDECACSPQEKRR